MTLCTGVKREKEKTNPVSWFNGGTITFGQE